MALDNFSINSSDFGIINDDLGLPKEQFSIFGDTESLEAVTEEKPKVKTEEAPLSIEDVPNDTPKEEVEDIVASINFDDISEPPAEEPTEPDTPDENVFTTISKDLVTAGVFSEDEEALPTNDEEFLARFNKESVNKANAQLTKFLEQFGKDRLDAFRAIFVNGVDPKEYFQIGTQSENILNLDMEQESNQKKVVRKYYTEVLNLPESRADKMLQGVIEDGELDAEATLAHTKFKELQDNKLAAVEQAKLDEQNRRSQEKQYFNHHVNQFLSTKQNSKDFEGLKFNDDISATVQRNLTQPAYKLPNGELITEFQKFIMELSNPENIEVAVKIALLKENNFDFTKIQSKKASEEKSKLFQTLNKTTNRTQPSKTVVKDDFTI